jgi:hypothetical protein
MATTMDLVEGLRNWQPLTAACVALVAVLIAQYCAARLARVAFRRGRGHERRVLAASLLSEIETLTTLMRELRHRDLCIAIRDNLQLHMLNEKEWAASEEPIAYPPAIYDKCADRLGLLDTETAAGVVRYYNYLAGFRSSMRIVVGRGAQSLQGRMNVLDVMIQMIDAEAPKVPALLERLRRLATDMRDRDDLASPF